MTDPLTTIRPAFLATLATILLPIPPAYAQNQGAPAPAPSPAPTQTPLRGLDGFSLPAAGATPVPVPAPPVVVLPTPTPSPSSTPRETPTGAAPVAARPRPAATPAPGAAPTPSATPMDRAAPVPVPTSSPSTLAPPPPSDAVNPSSAPSAAIQPDSMAAERGSDWLWWVIGTIIVVFAAVGAALLRRRRAGSNRPVAPAPVAIMPQPGDPAPAIVAAAPLPPPVAPVGPDTGAQHPAIDIALRPTRAGLNLLSAVVEGELVVTNLGATRLDAIHLGVGLLSAHKGQDTDLAGFFAQPLGRSAVPVFALEPGATRTVRIVAAAARTAIQPMSAGDRPIFVPIVALLCQFVSDGDPYRAVRGFAVGIERVDSAKLAPIWLDAPARMYDAVAARPHALPAGVF